jgi:YegS/Rv2252/BmrU family lipid kinase
LKYIYICQNYIELPEEAIVKVLLILNPKAGHKSGEKLKTQIVRKFEENNIELNFRTTERKGHGQEIIQNAKLEDYDGVVFCGGDGMAFEAINGYFRNNSKKRIPIGVIPIGTGNAYARDLDFEKNRWEEAVSAIAKQKTRKIDVGKFILNDETYYYYLNILGFGFVADVLETAQNLKFFGGSSYLLGVLYQTIFLHPFHLKIELDGKLITQNNIFVEISNTRYTGVDFLMSPDAKIDDGLLDIVLLEKVSRRKLLKSLPTIFKGEHIFLNEVTYKQAKHIKIETEIPKILTPDGELFGNTPIEVECLHQAVEVFCK